MSVAESRIRTILNHLEEGIMATLLAIMTLLTFIQVVLRYVFNSGWVWSLEATTYSFAWLVLIGLSYGVRTKTHIAVDMLTKRLPLNIRHFVALLAVVVCLCYSCLMVYGSFDFVNRLYTLGNDARDIPAPKWALTAIMPLSFTLLAYRFLEVGWDVIKGKDENMDFKDGEALSTTLHDSLPKEGDES